MDWKLRLKALWCRVMGHPEEESGPPYTIVGWPRPVVLYRCWCGERSAVVDANDGRRINTMRRPTR
jgi:hypothetical protein